MAKLTQQQIRTKIVNNCKDLTDLFGLDSGLTIIIREDIVIYGLLNSNKTFWSKYPHNQVSNIALYKKTITLSFLSDLSKELVSILE